VVIATDSFFKADVAAPIDNGFQPPNDKTVGFCGLQVCSKKEAMVGLASLDPVPRQLASPIVDLPVITG
jgi:hypothetical protein